MTLKSKIIIKLKIQFLVRKHTIQICNKTIIARQALKTMQTEH